MRESPAENKLPAYYMAHNASAEAPKPHVTVVTPDIILPIEATMLQPSITRLPTLLRVPGLLHHAISAHERPVLHAAFFPLPVHAA